MSETFGKLKLGTVTLGTMLSSSAVKFDGSGDLILCTAVSDLCIGIVHNATNFSTGHYVELNVSGVQVVIAQGTIAVGADLTSSASVDGAVVTAVATNIVIGKALASAADGEPFNALIYANKTLAKA